MLQLKKNQKALTLMDVFKAHRTPGVVKLLEENGFLTVLFRLTALRNCNPWTFEAMQHSRQT